MNTVRVAVRVEGVDHGLARIWISAESCRCTSFRTALSIMTHSLSAGPAWRCFRIHACGVPGMPPGLKFTDLQLRGQGVQNDCVTLTQPPERVAAPEGGERLWTRPCPKIITSTRLPAPEGYATERLPSGAARFMRSMHGCGTLAGLSLELDTFQKTAKIRRKSRSETSRRGWKTRKQWRP